MLSVFVLSNSLLLCSDPLLLICSTRIHPVVVAAHPSEPNQFALGLTDGGVYVLEPTESEGKWGIAPPEAENGGELRGSSAVGGGGKNQKSRKQVLCQ